MQFISKRVKGVKTMTQYGKILRELKKRPRRGMTNRDLFAYSNCPWKRIGELEAMGVKIKRVNDDDEPRLRRYILADQKQDRVAQLLEAYK